jgi:hypothetical protein
MARGKWREEIFPGDFGGWDFGKEGIMARGKWQRG